MNKLSALYLLSVVSVFLLSLLSGASGRCFNQEDLMEALANGRCWIVVENEIYDLTNNNWWQEGTHLGYSCGNIVPLSELETRKILAADLIDYYGAEEYAPEVGEFCQERTTKKIESCGDGSCNSGENFVSCPQDCPAGVIDGYCAAKWDFVCDPDCGRQEDPECICNHDGRCEVEFENYTNCPNDCPPAFKDGFCYKRRDNFCDPDCALGEDPDCVIEKTTTTTITSLTTTPTASTTITTTTLKSVKEDANYLAQLILGLIIIGGIIFLGYNLRKRSERTKKREKADETVDWLKNKLKEGEDPTVLKRGLEGEGYDPKLVDEAEKKLWS